MPYWAAAWAAVLDLHPSVAEGSLLQGTGHLPCLNIAPLLSGLLPYQRRGNMMKSSVSQRVARGPPVVRPRPLVVREVDLVLLCNSCGISGN